LAANTFAEKPWEKPFAKILQHNPRTKSAQARPSQKKETHDTELDGGIVARAACGVKRKGYKILW